MPKEAPKTDRGHVAYDRTTRSGTVSHINEKAKKKKAKVAEFTVGQEVYFKRPGEDQRTRRGKIKSKTRTGFVVTSRPDGKVSAAASLDLFVPAQHIMTIKEFEKKKAPTGTREAAGNKRIVSVTESNNRAATAARRFPLSETQVITNPKLQRMMSTTVTSLASKNGIRPTGGWENRGGISFAADNLEYNDLVSDYLTAAANSLRLELSKAPQSELDTFLAHLEGEEDGSRIFVSVTTAGRNAVMATLKDRARRQKEEISYDESEMEVDPGLRRKLRGLMHEDETPDLDGHDDGFAFDFDNDNEPHLWGDSHTYDPRGADPYEQMRYREAVIDHYVSKLPPHEREVIERKYALAEHMEPQTNDAIATVLKRKKVQYPAAGRDWNRQSVTPVHDTAIEHLRGMDKVDQLKEFWRALHEHLTLIKSHGPTRYLAPGIVLRLRDGRAFVTFDPKQIVASGASDLAKSYSSDLAKQNPGGRWITVNEGPLAGRHIFILPHKDGTATVLTGGGPAMRHKLLQPRKDEPAKKPQAEGSESKPSAATDEKKDEAPAKKELSEERRAEIETSRQQHREAIKEERGKLADIVREHLGQEVTLTDKDRDDIEKKIEHIADPKQKAAERLREHFAVKKEKDTALDDLLKLAKESVITEEPTAAAEEGEKQPTVAAVVKAHAEDLLAHYYQIKSLERENKELGKLLKTGNDKRPVSDEVKFTPLNKEDLKKIIVDEDLRAKEMAAHYKLAATVKGYVDDKGAEHKAKGGEGIERNIHQGGYEAVTGIVGELTGNSIMTKQVYDEIGARGAAVLAHYYLRNSGVTSKKLGEHLTDDLGKIGSEIAERAVRKGDEFMATADKVKQSGYGEDSLMEAAQARGAALKYVNKAYETYAQAQGALNQAAELAYESANNAGQIEIAAGSTATLEAKRRRLGLKANDVKIEKDGSGHKMTIKPEAFEKLLHEYATPKTGGIAGEGYSIEDIKAGRANTDDFHPRGINEYTPPTKDGVSTAIKIGANQQSAVRFIDKQKRVYLNYEAGTGKSLTVIAAKAHLEEQHGEPKKMIVSMPSPIMKNFAAEVKKFSNYNVAVIEPSDTPEQRRAKYNSGPDTIVVVNHEKMNFDGADIAKAGFHMVVADEAHTVTQKEGRGKSLKSEGLKNVAASAEHYIAMSGTPVPSSVSELYFHAHLMNPEKFSSQKEFMSRFGSVHKGEGMKQKIADFMNRELGDHVITAKKGQMLKPDGKPVELRMKTHFAPLSKTQRDEYRQTVAAVKSGEISQLQAENRMKGTLNDTNHADNGKFAHIKNIIDDHLAKKDSSEKVSLYVNSYNGADNIHDFLEKHYPGMGVVRFANRDRKRAGEKEGRSYTMKEKAGFIDNFKQDPSVRFAIHTMAGTTGLNVQHDGNGGGATTVVAVSSGEAGYSSIDQFFSRAYRTGANRDVDAHMVLTDTPYDLGTKLRLDEKKAIGDMLRSMPEGTLLLRKAHIREFQRRAQSGAVSTVKEHDDSRKRTKTFEVGGVNFSAVRRVSTLGRKYWAVQVENNQVDSSQGYQTAKDAETDIKDVLRAKRGDINAFRAAFGLSPIAVNKVVPSGPEPPKSTPAQSEEPPKKKIAMTDAQREQLRKMHSKVFKKAHIKGHTRTSQSGTVSQVKEHEDKRTGAWAIGHREGSAVGKFIDSAMEQFKLTKPEAEAALTYYQKHKLVKIDKTIGQFNVTDGRLWDKKALQMAAKMTMGLTKAHVRQHERHSASGATTTVREHEDKRTKKTDGQAKKARKGKRLADTLDAGLKDGSINKRKFVSERKAIREEVKTIAKQLKTVGPRKYKQMVERHAELTEKLGHYDEAYKKNEFLSPKQKAQLQWFRDKQKKVMPDNDHLLQAIAKLGGMRADACKSQWNLSNKEYPALTSTGIWGKPVLRVTGGVDPDTMAEMLAGHGFVKNDAGGKHDYRDFEDKLLRAAAGEKVMADHYVPEESEIQKEEAAYYENMRQSQLGQSLEDAFTPDLDAIGYDEETRAVQEAFDSCYESFMMSQTQKVAAKFYELDPSIPF